VANAILDGTDCVMLSEESAMGKFPIEAVKMLARIAVATEAYRMSTGIQEPVTGYNRDGDVHLVDLISRNLHDAVASLSPTAVLVPTVTGHAARMVSRFKLPVWIAAASSEEATCHGLQLSYGVSPIHTPEHPQNWNLFAKHWVKSEGLPMELVVLMEGPSRENPDANPRMEIFDLNHLV